MFASNSGSKVDEIQVTFHLDYEQELKSEVKSIEGTKATAEIKTSDVEVDTSRHIQRTYQLKSQLGDVSDEIKLEDAKDTQVSVAEFQGDRNTQEDAYDAQALAEFKKLSHADRIKALNDTFKELNKLCQNHENGSTACVTFSWLEDVPGSENQRLVTYTAYQGDSSAFFTRVDANNKVIESKRLNPTLHHPDQEKNINAGHAASIDGGLKLITIVDNKVGALAVSRALGDKSFTHSHPLFHTAEIAFDSIELKKGESAYVTIACDGYTECVGKPYKMNETVFSYNGKTIPMQEKLSQLKDKKSQEECFVSLTMQASLDKIREDKEPFKNLALHLAQWGYIKSKDNISVIAKKPGRTATYGAVYDGHGSSDVSKLAQKHFPSIMRRHVEQLRKAQRKVWTPVVTKTGKLTPQKLKAQKGLNQHHVEWILGQVLDMKTAPKPSRKSTTFFSQVSYQDDLSRLKAKLTEIYEGNLLRNTLAGNFQNIFIQYVTELLQNWDQFCESNKKVVVPADEQKDAARVNGGLLSFVNANSKSYAVQHKIAHILQTLSEICRQYPLKWEERDQEIMSQLMRFPVEPASKPSGSCFSRLVCS